MGEQLSCLILGSGGHAKVLIEAIQSSDQEIIGILTPSLVIGTNFMRLPVLGDDDAVSQFDADQVLLINGVGSIPQNNRRWHLAQLMRNRGFQFGMVLHQRSTVASDVLLDEGVQVMSGVIIQPSCKIGLDTILNTGALIDHDCVIGNCCHIAPGVTLNGGVRVGNNVHIGTGAQVIQGISIGNGVVIAAGTTVYRDVPDKMLVRQKSNLIMESIQN